VDWAAENGYCETNDPILCSFSDEAIWGYVYRDDSFYDGHPPALPELGAKRASVRGHLMTGGAAAPAPSGRSCGSANLRKEFDGGRVVALDDVSIDIHQR
jgi:hypothetical protein